MSRSIVGFLVYGGLAVHKKGKTIPLTRILIYPNSMAQDVHKIPKDEKMRRTDSAYQP
jgi:hypothetical protein